MICVNTFACQWRYKKVISLIVCWYQCNLWYSSECHFIFSLWVWYCILSKFEPFTIKIWLIPSKNNLCWPTIVLKSIVPREFINPIYRTFNWIFCHQFFIISVWNIVTGASSTILNGTDWYLNDSIMLFSAFYIHYWCLYLFFKVSRSNS